MNFQKVISHIFILMVMLSSTGLTSPNDFMVEPDELPVEIGSQICEDSDVDLLEFRQTITVNVSVTPRIIDPGFSHQEDEQAFNTLTHVQFNTLHQKSVSGSPSKKLFIDFGTLVI